MPSHGCKNAKPKSRRAFTYLSGRRRGSSFLVQIWSSKCEKGNFSVCLVCLIMDGCLSLVRILTLSGIINVLSGPWPEEHFETWQRKCLEIFICFSDLLRKLYKPTGFTRLFRPGTAAGCIYNSCFNGVLWPFPDSLIVPKSWWGGSSIFKETWTFIYNKCIYIHALYVGWPELGKITF